MITARSQQSLHPNELLELTVSSSEGTEVGDTAITVEPELTSGNSYKYKVLVNAAPVEYDQILTTGWTDWDGEDEITAETGKVITVVEVDENSKAKAAGHATVVAKAEEEDEDEDDGPEA